MRSFQAQLSRQAHIVHKTTGQVQRVVDSMCARSDHAQLGGRQTLTRCAPKRRVVGKHGVLPMKHSGAAKLDVIVGAEDVKRCRKNRNEHGIQQGVLRMNDSFR